MQNQKILEEKARALDVHRVGLTPEEDAVFDEEQWAQNHDQEHPVGDVPEEVADDVDNDY